MAPTFPAARMAVSPAWPSTNPRPRRFVQRTGRDVWTTSGPLAYPESIQRGRYRGRAVARGRRASRWSRWFCSRQPRLVDGRTFPCCYSSRPAGANLRGPVGHLDPPLHGDTRRSQAVVSGRLRRSRRASYPMAPAIAAVDDERARRWAGRTRAWINAGITLLLAGIAVGVVPPGPISSVRWPVITVAWIGVAVEASWVAAMMLDERARLGMLVRSGAVFDRGGRHRRRWLRRRRNDWPCSRLVGGDPSARGGSVLACGLHGRPSPSWPGTGARSADRRTGRLPRAALAPVAPAVFVLALWSAVEEICEGPSPGASAQHPGRSKSCCPRV